MDLRMLPDDILHAIFRKLSAQGVMRCRSVCRRWQEAVDSLSDQDWKEICYNCNLYKDYAAVRNKYGLSWKDCCKAINSWKSIGTAEMSSQKLCDNVDYFKVLPEGIVACLQNHRHKELLYDGYSDTIVYYNTKTFKKNYKDEYEFCFSSQWFDENEYFKVMYRFDGSLCIVLKETKQLFVVGHLNRESIWGLTLPSNSEVFNLIGKEVYFKNTKDEIIYVSKLKQEDGVSTVETEPLEAFLENHDSYEEDIVAFAVVKGNVHILSDEGNKGNIYIHENADFGWVAQPMYDQSDIFLELEEYGFDWKSPAIYDWLRTKISIVRPAFYSHGNVYLTTRSYRKTVCIHYFPYYIYGPDHLLKLFKGKPLRKFSTQELLDDKKHPHASVRQMDIIETPTNHKVLVLVANKLFVLEFIPSKKNKNPKTTAHGVKKIGKKTKKQLLLDLKKTSNKTSKKKPAYTTKKKAGQTQKQTNRKTVKSTENLPHKHSYATRSTSKI